MKSFKQHSTAMLPRTADGSVELQRIQMKLLHKQAMLMAQASGDGIQYHNSREQLHRLRNVPDVYAPMLDKERNLTGKMNESLLVEMPLQTSSSGDEASATMAGLGRTTSGGDVDFAVPLFTRRGANPRVKMIQRWDVDSKEVKELVKDLPKLKPHIKTLKGRGGKIKEQLAKEWNETMPVILSQMTPMLNPDFWNQPQFEDHHGTFPDIPEGDWADGWLQGENGEWVPWEFVPQGPFEPWQWRPRDEYLKTAKKIVSEASSIELPENVNDKKQTEKYKNALASNITAMLELNQEAPPSVSEPQGDTTVTPGTGVTPEGEENIISEPPPPLPTDLPIGQETLAWYLWFMENMDGLGDQSTWPQSMVDAYNTVGGIIDGNWNQDGLNSILAQWGEGGGWSQPPIKVMAEPSEINPSGEPGRPDGFNWKNIGTEKSPMRKFKNFKGDGSDARTIAPKIEKGGKITDKDGNVLDLTNLQQVNDAIQGWISSGEVKVVEMPPQRDSDDDDFEPNVTPNGWPGFPAIPGLEDPRWPTGHPNGPVGPPDPNDPSIPYDPDGKPYWWWDLPWGPFVPGFVNPFPGNPDTKPDPHRPLPPGHWPHYPGGPLLYPPNQWPYGPYPTPDGGVWWLWPGYSPWRPPYVNTPGTLPPAFTLPGAPGRIPKPPPIYKQ